MYQIKSFLRAILRKIYRVLITIKSLFVILYDKNYTCATSYFPEYADRRKNRLRIYWDQFIHTIKYSRPNYYYFLYGLDIKGRKNDYVDYTLFMHQRDNNNNITAPNSSVGVLRNKFYFGLIANSLGIPTPHNIGIIHNGEIYDLSNRITISLCEFVEKLTGKLDVFVKSIDGECGDGVYHAIIEDGKIIIDKNIYDVVAFTQLLQDGRFLVQQCITQHDAINKIFNKSINTIRLETVYDYKTRNIKILPPLLRVGCGDNNVDNWAMGGLAIGINVEKGVLEEYGFYKPSYGTKVNAHPDSGVIFKDYEIPYINESIELAMKFHSYFPDIHSIGWDIAITENGPCIIEGNDNWEISLVQICSYGLQREFDSLFYNSK